MNLVGKYRAKERTEVIHKSRHFSRTTSMHSLSSKSVNKESSEPTRHTKRVTFSKQRPVEPLHKEIEVQTGLTSCLIAKSTSESRLSGGQNNPADPTIGWIPQTSSECKIQAPGINFLIEKDTNVTSFEVKLGSGPMKSNIRQKCDFFPKFVDPSPYKEQTTQTLYRESSAQTLAYLPEIVDKDRVEGLELFRLASLLPGDKPPGLYEVELLERARKRWAFTNTLKINFQKQLHETRELAIKSEYKTIMQAFEWEKWIEREEYIQECQMTRLEIVVRMFDKREKEMHAASKTRIEKACERIQARRQAELSKNEAEYQREMRRLQLKHMNVNRRWVKENPVYAMSNYCSEQYAPAKRHGDNPAQRHFVGKAGRRAFDMRIDELEKRVNMKRLQCPYSKLKEWSKPKETVKEYEQNFCSDQNLKKLYESLKGLRTQAAKHKTTPKCLKKLITNVSEDSDRLSIEDVDYTALYEEKYRLERQAEKKYTVEEMDAFERARIVTLQVLPRNRAKEHLEERRFEDLENLLHMYEGTTIGWIMQFLSEEMERLKEQRNLHFLTMMAQKERWRREAAEAGLRQKENEMRIVYEELFQQNSVGHIENADNYLKTILTTDMSHAAHLEATETITELAMKIDEDIQRWLNNLNVIQTPLTFEPLRVTLRDMIFPDLNEALKRHEKSLIVKYIIDDVMFPNIWQILEPFDICTTLTSDLIDRLIDNDLFLFSTDSESESRPSTCEAEAIIRKLIRQAVPGRRWKTESERIVTDTYDDMFDDIFTDILWKIDNEPYEPGLLHAVNAHPLVVYEFNRLLVKLEKSLTVSSLTLDDELIRTQMLSLIKKLKNDDITRELQAVDIFDGEDNIRDSDLDTLIAYEVFTRATAQHQPEDLYSVFSALDMGELSDIKELRRLTEKLKMLRQTETSSSLSDIGIAFDKRKSKERLLNLLRSMVSSSGYDNASEEVEGANYEADDEQSLFHGETAPQKMDTAEDGQSEKSKDTKSKKSVENEIIVDGVSKHGISVADLKDYTGSVIVRQSERKGHRDGESGDSSDMTTGTKVKKDKSEKNHVGESGSSSNFFDMTTGMKVKKDKSSKKTADIEAQTFEGKSEEAPEKLLEVTKKKLLMPEEEESLDQQQSAASAKSKSRVTVKDSASRRTILQRMESQSQNRPDLESYFSASLSHGAMDPAVLGNPSEFILEQFQLKSDDSAVTIDVPETDDGQIIAELPQVRD